MNDFFDNLNQMDEAGRLMASSFPALVRQMYLGFIEQEFTDEQAMALTITFLQELMAGGR